MGATQPPDDRPPTDPNAATDRIARDNGPAPDPPAAASRKRLGEGDVLAQYTIRKRLGSGGMGAVYLAWDGHLQRYVALKVLHPKLADLRECVDRFLREARSAAGIAHDHVVTIHQVGTDRDIPFIAMQCLQGVSLDRYLEKKGLPPVPQVLRIGREAAAGLGAAHALGIVHRDIKPANLWLESPSGRVKVLDFGLAKPIGDETANLTQPGMVVGTPQYMSPEQARGKSVDARSDLFSLGCVLFELCVGRSPFAGPTTLAVLSALAADTPPRVDETNPRVPGGLSELIAELLAKDPADRPGSADEVIARLTEVETALSAPRPATAVIGTPARAPSTPAPTEEVPETFSQATDETPPTVSGSAPARRKRTRRKARRQSLVVPAVAGGAVFAGLLIVAGLIWKLGFQTAKSEVTPPSANVQPAGVTPVVDKTPKKKKDFGRNPLNWEPGKPPPTQPPDGWEQGDPWPWEEPPPPPGWQTGHPWPRNPGPPGGKFPPGKQPPGGPEDGERRGPPGGERRGPPPGGGGGQPPPDGKPMGG